MEPQNSLNNPSSGRYYYSADLLRFGLVICLILARYGVPFFSDYITVFLPFATGTLYLLYGFFVLRDGADLRRNIRHAFRVFAIMFGVCFVLAEAYMLIVYGSPFAYLTKRGIFNFIVLNYWGPNMGDYIWYVQSILYSLIVCRLFRKLKKYDVVICALLFVISFLVGEGAGLIHFNVLGYTYIPGNFLTRTLPYMLLGRILYRKREQLRKVKPAIWLALLAAGLLLCIAELIGFTILGVLVYYGHLLGFIPISIGLTGLMVQKRHIGKQLVLKHDELYKKVFFLFNPVGEILLVVIALVFTDQDDYTFMNRIAGILVCIICVFLVLGWEWYAQRRSRKKQKALGAEEAQPGAVTAEQAVERSSEE